MQFDPQNCQINILYCIYCNHNYSCQHTPEQRWYPCVEESGCVRAEGEEVWAEREMWWVRTPWLFLHGERAVIAEFLWMKYGGQFLWAE